MRVGRKVKTFCLFVCLFVCLFQDMVSLCNSALAVLDSLCRPGLASNRDLPASASQALGLKAHATTARTKLYFLNRVFLGSPGYPGTHSVGQAGLKQTLRDLPASASRVLELA